MNSKDYESLQDEQIITLFQEKRDERLFETLYLRYKNKIYGYIRQFFLYQSDEDAKELLNEVFIKVYQSLPKLNNAGAFKVWIYRIARNVCINWLKKNKKNKQEISFDKLGQTIESDYLNPEENTLKHERRIFILKSILKLIE